MPREKTKKRPSLADSKMYVSMVREDRSISWVHMIAEREQ